MPDVSTRAPLTLRMHANDNVAIVANDGGLPEGTRLPDGVPGAGLVLRDKVPQGHKVALADIPEGGVVLRYNVPIGYAAKPISAGMFLSRALSRLPSRLSRMYFKMARSSASP